MFRGLLTSFGPVDVIRSPWKIRWPTVNRVCRYWRRTALYTPELWTAIQAFGDDSYPSCQYFASLSLARSGVLPLTVHYRDGTGGIGGEILSNLSRVRELTLACTSYDALRPLTPSATQLRILMIKMYEYLDATGNLDLSMLFNGWDTPNLETVHITKCNVWQEIPIVHLRRLAIIGQTFSPITLRKLFHVLSSNTHLEDLVVEDLSFRHGKFDELHSFLRTQAPLHMASLKRLYICGSTYTPSPQLTILLNQRVISTAEQWARYYYYSDSIIEPLRRPNMPAIPTVLAARTLSISTDKIVGSDGRSIVAIQFTTLSRHIADCLEISDVRELWMTCGKWHDTIFALAFGMQQVTTLVFPDVGSQDASSDVLSWLPKISTLYLFPALKELRVNVSRFSQTMSPLILAFLQRRKEIGQKIRVLRIMRDPRPGKDADAFESWRRSPSEFASLVDHVFFDELDDYPRMELPDVFKAPWPLDDSYPRLWPSLKKS